MSDLHLGAPNQAESRAREHAFIRWLDVQGPTMEALFIVGDLFDFWFEYKKAVPRGFVRTLGKLAALRDSGVPIHFFTGNHDIWVFDYLENEIGLKVYREPTLFEFYGKSLLVGHGDGLGPGDHGYKMIKKVFNNRFLQWLFARVHPNAGIGLADFFSRKSRAKTGNEDAIYKGKESEWLYQFAVSYQRENPPVDYFIFGHRHLPMEIQLPEEGVYFNLGDWIKYNTYGVLSPEKFSIEVWEKDPDVVIRE